MDKQGCGACYFWRPRDTDAEIGECHRGHPVIVIGQVEREAEGDCQYLAAWPETLNFDWCGEWKPTVPVVSEDAPKLSVYDLGLPLMTANALHYANIRSVADLVGYTAEELLEKRQFGEVGLSCVREQLAARGLTLRGEVSK